MLSVVDELCMPAYINVRRFHWILIIISVDDGIVQTLDSLGKEPREYVSVVQMIDR
jgi:Ulp1 family protease